MVSNGFWFFGGAVEIGTTNEGQAIAAEYIVDRQLQVQHQRFNIGMDEELLREMDNDAKGSGLDFSKPQGQANLLSIVDITALKTFSFNSNQFFSTVVSPAGKIYGDKAHPSSSPQLTYLQLWLDEWISVNVYELKVPVSAQLVDIGANLKSTKFKAFVVHGNDADGWTFSGTDVPLVARLY